MDNIEAKKRMMFIKGEDFYFLTYLIFIILDGYNCYGESYFKDYRKFSYIIDFVSDRRICRILGKNKINEIEKNILFETYTNSVVRERLVRRILFSLEKRGYINLQRKKNSKTIDISIKKADEINALLNDDLFVSEIDNLNLFKSYVKRVGPMTSDRLVSEIYEKRGVSSWAI